MNERIKELAEQCGFRSNPDVYDRNQSFDIPKFSELIIKECLLVCEKVSEAADVETGNKFLTETGIVLHEGIWAGAENCHWSIKQHFGIEE